MAEKRSGLNLFPGARTTVAIVLANETIEIPGVETISYEAGAKESTTINAFQGSATNLGDAPIESVTLTLSLIHI